MVGHAQHPLLEAQALLAQYRWRAPFANPGRALICMQRAEQIFRAHGQPESAANCCIEQACALADLGQEFSAIQLVEGALSGPELHLDDRLHAHLTIAACRFHTGDIDGTGRYLRQFAEPLVGAGARASLQSRFACMQGMVLMASLIARHSAEFWLTYVGLPEPQQLSHSMADAVLWMDRAKSLLPDGHPSGHLRLAHFGGLALLGDDDRAVDELEKLSQEAGYDDPALAVRVRFTQAMVQRRQGHAGRALGLLADALATANTWGQLALARDIRLQQSQIYEGLGQASLALEVLKAHGLLVARSLRSQPAATAATTQQGQDDEVAKTVGSGTPVRMLEPAYLRKAVRFVTAQVGSSIRVSDVVAHCGVSRRTLENGFREHKSTSVAAFIVRHQMERAADALRYTRRSVQAIASEAGYRSQSAFSREFKRRFGALPSLWRQRLDMSDSD